MKNKDLKVAKVSTTVVIINGSGGVGKDLFCYLCEKYNTFVHSISSIDPIKDFAKKMGWDSIKNDKSRKFLSDIKKLVKEFNNGNVNYIIKKIKDHEDIIFSIEGDNNNYNSILFVHIREPEEIDEVKTWCIENGYRVKTLLMTRNNIEKITTNESDKNVDNYDYDFIIKNNSDEDNLAKCAYTFTNVLEIDNIPKPFIIDSKKLEKIKKSLG